MYEFHLAASVSGSWTVPAHCALIKCGNIRLEELEGLMETEKVSDEEREERRGDVSRGESAS